MNMQRTNVVVVGVDGSECATVAADWAAAEAQRRGAELRMVQAWDVSFGFASVGTIVPPNIFDDVENGARSALGAARDKVQADHPNLLVSTALARGLADQVLLTAGQGALLTVVGSRGHTRIAELVLGSVALRVAAKATGPVVVVRGVVDDVPIGAAGPVWAGLDGSPNSEDALAFAFEEASMRGVRLVAIHSWTNEPSDGFLRAYPMEFDNSRFEQEQVLLAEQLAGWSEKYPDVTVASLLLRGRPAGTLLNHLEQTELPDRPALLVVGSRGHGGFAGLLLGSTSQALISHAPCPVAVVKPQTRR